MELAKTSHFCPPPLDWTSSPETKREAPVVIFFKKSESKLIDSATIWRFWIVEPSLIDKTNVDTLAAANFFHHHDQSYYLIKKYLYEKNYNVRKHFFNKWVNEIKQHTYIKLLYK